MGKEFSDFDLSIHVEAPIASGLTQKNAEQIALSEEERERRIELVKRATRGEELMRHTVQDILLALHGGTGHVEDAVRAIETFETLQYGNIVDREPVGQTTHPVERLVFDGKPEQAGYAKREQDRVRYCVRDNKVFEVHHVWDGPSRSYVREEKPLREDMSWDQFRQTEQGAKQQAEHFHETRKTIASHYGVDEARIELNMDALGSRASIPARELERSVGVSALDLMTGLNTVPLTIVRREKSVDPLMHDRDLFVVQEAIDGKRGGQYDHAEPVTLEMYEELRDQGITHPAAESWMDNACAAYLYGALDGNLNNMRRIGNTFKTFDCDNVLGYSITDTRDGKTRGRPLDLLVSPPLEAVTASESPLWVLTEEKRAGLERLYNACLTYVSWKEGKTPSNTFSAVTDEELDRALEGIGSPGIGVSEPRVISSFHVDENDLIPSAKEERKIARALSDIFRYIFHDDTIAAREVVQFLERLKYLVEHGRPPALVQGEDLAPLTERDLAVLRAQRDAA